MSLLKKDPSLRVAANDPHLVSLGGGRLSTAVTIHNIPVGDCTIGSSPQCSVSISGVGVRPIHCTIYRSEENQVTLVPERNARILIDNQLIKNEVDLRQGAMITVGDSYYLRYNNPAEALKMRTAMGESLEYECPHDLVFFDESNVNHHSKPYFDNSTYSYYDTLKKSDTSSDFLRWQCPKVFNANLVTVNIPAKDVLGQKYASFAKNLAGHHRKDKNLSVLNANSYINSNVALNNTIYNNKELLNTKSTQPLEDMLKICAEYTDRQDRSYGGNNSSTPSPIVQNRIKTNGSLPRDKKSPFYQELLSSFKGSNNSLNLSSNCTGYENVQLLHQNRLEIIAPNKSSGCENKKIVPQSPRTKIRTNCMSPKKESNLNNSTFNQNSANTEKSTFNYEDINKPFEVKFQKEIDDIGENSILAACVEKSVSNKSTPNASRKTNKNINNLTIDINSSVFPYKSPIHIKKPTPAPRKINQTKTVDTESISNLIGIQSSHGQMHKEREDLIQRIRSLKAELSLLQKQDNEALIEMDLPNTLIMTELQSLTESKQKLNDEYQLLQQTIYRLDAQRNATRVMEENHQSKLKHSIEMKQDQLKNLKELLKQKPENMCLKEELINVRESLENDQKSFEDLEFHYFEGETEWQACREDLISEKQMIKKEIEKCQLSIQNFAAHEPNSSYTVNTKHRRLSYHLVSLIKELHQCEKQFKLLERKLSLKINSNSSLSEQEYDRDPSNFLISQTQIRQSFFRSTEMLCSKTYNDNMMTKSVNENMFYNNKTDFFRSELTLDNAKSYTESIALKNGTCKIYDSLKKIEKQRDLDYEKSKIEDLLRKLSSDAKHHTIVTNRKGGGTIERNMSTIQIQKEYSQNAKVTSSAATYLPLPAASYELYNKLSPKMINKSINELNILPDSPSNFYIDDNHSRSVLSNEIFPQGNISCMSSDHKKTQQQKPQRPLTRYMPIFSKDLNLKRHIESAGHPISLCPHVFLDEYSCRGYLHKLGSMFHTWSKRWFVLDRERNALIYYADKSERKPRGGAYFLSIDEVYMDHLNISKSSRLHSTFIVKTKKRIYYLQASSDTAARIWIDAIITGAQGNIDYQKQ